MTNMNYDFEQRVIYRALTRMTQDFALIQSGFQFWVSTFSQNELDPDTFADALKNYLGISNDQKRVFVVGLHSSLAADIDDLEPVPGVMLAGGQSAAPQTNQFQANQAQEKKATKDDKFAPANSAHFIVTSHFMQTMAKAVCREGSSVANDLSEIVTETIEDIKDTRLHNPIMNWAKNSFSRLSLPHDISKQSCIDVAHFLYLAASDAVGPVQSDLIMDKVIKLLKNLDEAERFDPYSLI